VGRAGSFSLSIGADKRELAAVHEFIERHVRPVTGDMAPVYDLLVAVHEIVTNIIEHGYRGRPGVIEITLWTADGALVVQVRDDAPPFDPTQAPPPDLSVPLADRPPGGMGIVMARHFVDTVSYRSPPEGGNELTMIKHGVVAGHKDKSESTQTQGANTDGDRS
jgi:serine/threonine-protein kinase RsbW